MKTIKVDFSHIFQICDYLGSLVYPVHHNHGAGVSISLLPLSSPDHLHPGLLGLSQRLEIGHCLGVAVGEDDAVFAAAAEGDIADFVAAAALVVEEDDVAHFAVAEEGNVLAVAVVASKDDAGALAAAEKYDAVAGFAAVTALADKYSEIGFAAAALAEKYNAAGFAVAVDPAGEYAASGFAAGECNVADSGVAAAAGGIYDPQLPHPRHPPFLLRPLPPLPPPHCPDSPRPPRVHGPRPGVS